MTFRQQKITLYGQSLMTFKTTRTNQVYICLVTRHKNKSTKVSKAKKVELMKVKVVKRTFISMHPLFQFVVYCLNSFVWNLNEFPIKSSSLSYGTQSEYSVMRYSCLMEYESDYLNKGLNWINLFNGKKWTKHLNSEN